MPRSSPPPPPPGPRHHHAKHRAVALDGHAIDRALRHVVADPGDRAFVLRCILNEGPLHHRVASWALLRMLASLLESSGAQPYELARVETSPLAMRLPPNVASASDDPRFPIGLPTRLLRQTLGDADLPLAVECLTDGPPHHALANAVMAWLIEALEHELSRRAGAVAPAHGEPSDD